MKEKFGVFDAVVYLLMAFVLVVTLYPLLHVVAVSFSDSAQILQNKVGIIPRGFSLDAYEKILETMKVPRAFFNSILYAVVGTTANLVMTAVMAYPLSKTNLVGRSVFMKLIIFTLLFNGGTIPTYLVVDALGLIDSMWSLVLPNAIWTMELFILVSFYRSLPASLFESAKLDGASELTILLRIVLPLSKASLASIALFYFMGHWNSYFLPLIYLTSSEKFPLQLVLKDMLISDSTQVSGLVESAALTPAAVKNATIVITMVPVMLAYPFAQKYFVKGVMIGSIKG